MVCVGLFSLYIYASTLLTCVLVVVVVVAVVAAVSLLILILYTILYIAHTSYIYTSERYGGGAAASTSSLSVWLHKLSINTAYPTRCVGLSTYVIKSFLLFHSTVTPIIFIFVCSKFFHQSFFTSPPPGSCHPFFTFYPTLHLPDFLQPACFSACLLLLRVSLCPYGTTRVSLSVWVGLKGFCVCLLLLKKGG